MSIEIRNISKQFGDFRALDDVNLDIASGELIALLGPSGCGKTTLLRHIIGLTEPARGEVRLFGEALRAGDRRERLSRQRRMGVLFTEHSMDVVFGQADRVLVLVRGRLLAEGTPEQIQADARVQEAYLGAGFDVGDAA